MRTYFRLILVASFIGLLIASCGKSDKEKYCDDREDLQESVTDLANAVRSLDVDRTKDSAAKVRTNIEAVKESGSKISAPPSGQLEADYARVKSSVDALGEGGSTDVRTGLTNLATSLADFEKTADAYYQAYSCD
jgi:hypothetical protein